MYRLPEHCAEENVHYTMFWWCSADINMTSLDESDTLKYSYLNEP
jgi:hypothetical protein